MSTKTITRPTTTATEEAKSEQVAEKPKGYSPAADSTPAKKGIAEKTGRLVLVVAGDDGLCTCGCGGKASSRFLPGHDAKLKGKLTRATIADVGLLLIINDQQQEATTRQFADALSKTSKYDWTAGLEEAVARAKKAEQEAEARRAENERKRQERAAQGKGKSPKITLEDFATANK